MKPLFVFCILIVSCQTCLYAQLDVHFQKDTMRLNSDSKRAVDTFLIISVERRPVGSENIKIKVSPTKNLSLSLNDVRVPPSNEFPLSDTSGKILKYPITIPRDQKDDKFIEFEVSVTDKDNNPIALKKGVTKTILYIKPYVDPSVTSNRNLEMWLHTGTNFDPFDGAKPQEFFFRWNTVFKITSHVFGQVSFYKNRYFNSDSTVNSPVFQPATPPTTLSSTGLTQYRYIKGSYKSTSTQTIDVLGLQLDGLYELNSNHFGNSAFYADLSFDINTRKTTIKFNNSFDTMTYIRDTPIPRDTPIYSLPPTRPTAYKTPLYNIGLGFMWIYDDADLNIKGQLVAGWSNSIETVQYPSYTRGFALGLVQQVKENNVYMQTRLYATYKPIGFSFGGEVFLRRNSLAEFNFTISKVFELQNFAKLFSTISSLETKAK